MQFLAVVLGVVVGWLLRDLLFCVKTPKDPQPVGPRPSVQDLDCRAVFATYRGVVEHEDNLVDQRFTWLLLIEGLLITAVLSKADWVHEKIDGQVALLGIAISVGIGLTTIGAFQSIAKCKRSWRALLADFRACPKKRDEANSLPELTYQTSLVMNYTFIVPTVSLLLIPAFWCYLVQQ